MLQNILCFFISRSKTLLKRRKKQVKKLPISQKRLKEDEQYKHISHKIKQTQIQKQLNKKVNTNHHLNQIMDQMFYPDIKTNNLELFSITNRSTSVKQLSHQNISVVQIERELYQALLASQLLQVHQNYEKQFNLKHYETLLMKMGYYFKNIQEIRQKRIKNWQNMINKMAESQKNKKKLKMPDLFIEKNQIVDYPPWKKFLNKFAQVCVQEASIKEICFKIQLGIKIFRLFRYIPYSIYYSMTQQIIKLDQTQLSREQKVCIIRFLGNKALVKHGSQTKSLEYGKNLTNSINYLGISLSKSLINDPQCTAQDLGAIIRTQKGGVKFINYQLVRESIPIMMKYLKQTNFERTVDYLFCILGHHVVPSIQTLQLLKYDMYRKSSMSLSKNHLLQAMSFIKCGFIFIINNITNSQIKMQAKDLFQKLAEKISQYIRDDNLSPKDLSHLVSYYFDNNLCRFDLLQMVSGILIRYGDSFSLEELSDFFMKLTLLKYRSSILAKYVLNKFITHYTQKKLKYSEELNFYLPNYTETNSVKQQIVNLKQIYLQQYLIMNLWCVIQHQNEDQFNKINLDSLLEIYPSKIQTNEIIIREIIPSIDRAFDKFKIFPKCRMQSKQPIVSNRMSIYYLKQFEKSRLLNLMHQEALISQLFIFNYHTKWHRYLEQRWSSDKIISQKQYAEWCKSNQNSHLCFFNPQVMVSDEIANQRYLLSTQYFFHKQKQNMKEQEIKHQDSTINQTYKYYKFVE